MATLERDNTLLVKIRDAGDHRCRYEYPGRKPCKRCEAERAYIDRDEKEEETTG
jgi:hypothetical protein